MLRHGHLTKTASGICRYHETTMSMGTSENESGNETGNYTIAVGIHA